jgi:NAD(P)-dependent dehydrogenase (short-subunit alcohol dehydrogenase family)
MDRALDNKICLVTGGTAGIGRAAAMRVAREGAVIVIAGRNAADGADVVQAIREDGGDARFVAVDVSRAEEVEALIADVVATHGRIDCAVNGAAIAGAAAPLAEQTEATFDHVMAVNLKGVWLCMKHELASMAAQGRGAIVNVAAVAGLTGRASASLYAASKHGVIGLTRSAAVEYAAAGIRVNAVCPGAVQMPARAGSRRRRSSAATVVAEAATPWWIDLVVPPSTRVEQPTRARIGRPEDVAEAIAWLCSDASSYVSGTTLVVDGGMTAGW